MLVIRLIMESIRFAANALRANLLRTILSLLGVTIGIFAIIAVLTLVDSLESSIKNSLNFLGSDNINIEKWPYGFGGGVYPWWDYFQRPYPDYNDFRFLEKNLNNAAAITILTSKGGAILKKDNNSSDGVNMVGATYGYKDVFELPIEAGRYFSNQEMEGGSNVVIIGYRLKKELFPFESPIGKQVKIKGLKFAVIGTIKEEGESLLGAPSNDDNVILPYKSFKKFYFVGRRRGNSSTISVKGLKSDVGLEKLEGELRGLMRSRRGLKPKQVDDFALNRPEAIANFIGKTFDVLSIAGWVIGSFSMLVGGFGIANIMFVSVRERTNIIGIQKSLGAKNYFILYQFLFESVFLSVLGGLIGMFLVFLLTFVDLGSLELTMSTKNIIIGVSVSSIIGLLAGIIPAHMASKMDPVIAIRS
jgi:putative ABC transport system permease protein